MNELDIYEYNKRFEMVIRRAENTPISDRNKKLIFKFQEQCIINKTRKPRMVKSMEILFIDESEVNLNIKATYFVMRG